MESQGLTSTTETSEFERPGSEKLDALPGARKNDPTTLPSRGGRVCGTPTRGPLTRVKGPPRKFGSSRGPSARPVTRSDSVGEGGVRGEGSEQDFRSRPEVDLGSQVSSPGSSWPLQSCKASRPPTWVHGETYEGVRTGLRASRGQRVCPPGVLRPTGT